MKFAPIALVGSPNCGKTTLFNWLTGSRYKTVNYPGATVEYSMGQTHSHFGESFLVMDTPGTYSLFPKSNDEQVTVDALFNHPTYGVAKVVIVVVDATQMDRHLYLFKQIKQAGFKAIVALTMMDLLEKQGQKVDVAQLSESLNARVVPIKGLEGEGVSDLVKQVKKTASSAVPTEPLLPSRWSREEANAQQREVVALCRKVLSQGSKPKSEKELYLLTAKLDSIFLHPVSGLFTFALVMIGLFSSIYWVAAPFMDFVDMGFGALSAQVSRWGPGALWADFASNGVITSVGAVLVFVPQIFILFLGIGLLEDSGYLARAATMIDKPFSKIGLNGRAFVPLLSAYACAIPAMMATRHIGSKRERWLTMFVIPLMTCSARLPVYALLLTFLFYGAPAWKPGLTLAGLYLGSLIVGALSAGVANRVLKKQASSMFMLELPIYRVPNIGIVLKSSLTRTKNYIKSAGPIIFAFALVVWLLTTFPDYKEEDNMTRLNQSYLAQFGKVIEPVFEPMGVDWRTGVGIISAFAAREVFVSSLAILFNVGDAESEETLTASLIQNMQHATNTKGEQIFTLSSVIGLVLFFMIALQCMSTVGVAKQEMGSWRFALSQLFIYNLAAYILAVGVVQTFRLFGLS